MWPRAYRQIGGRLLGRMPEGGWNPPIQRTQMRLDDFVENSTFLIYFKPAFMRQDLMYQNLTVLQQKSFKDSLEKAKHAY
ncbi:hypothetical protein CEXT_38211 [Caerostris extrusa]|uniref:Uncharacterized protein n=1 Tax=Caerostris extrusa TaxID=172846 RepID=A0AAV4WDH3_CAEEX|nr:hypothetical protein CEXT_38211 [Caerostris extrusa]